MVTYKVLKWFKEAESNASEAATTVLWTGGEDSCSNLEAWPKHTFESFEWNQRPSFRLAGTWKYDMKADEDLQSGKRAQRLAWWTLFLT